MLIVKAQRGNTKEKLIAESTKWKLGAYANGSKHKAEARSRKVRVLDGSRERDGNMTE